MGAGLLAGRDGNTDERREAVLLSDEMAIAVGANLEQRKTVNRGLAVPPDGIPNDLEGRQQRRVHAGRVARVQVVQAPDYHGLSPAEQAKRLEKAAVNGIEKAKKLLYNDLIGGFVIDANGRTVKAATTTERYGQAIALSLGRFAKSNYERAMLLDGQRDKLTDPAFVKAILENFPTKDSKGEPLPTIAEYRQAAPLLKQLEAMPRFADGLGRPIGDQTIWKQYDIERKAYNAIANDPTKSATSSALAQASFRITHPVYLKYSYLANSDLGANPQATALRKQYPILLRFPLPTD